MASNTSPGIGVDLPSTEHPGRFAIRAAIFWLLFCLTRATLAQEYLPPSSEAKIAVGVAALKSGDLDGAEKSSPKPSNRASSTLSSIITSASSPSSVGNL